MEITEVRIFLKEGPDKKLKAYATLTFDDCFVVRNVKVIQGNKGLFVAMPSRKVRESCPKCNFKNAIRSRYCNHCGASLPQHEQVETKDNPSAARQAEHRDIAHPITLDCREKIQKKVLIAYEGEVKRGPQALSEKDIHENDAPPKVEENKPAEAEVKPDEPTSVSDDQMEGKDIAL